MNFFTTCGFRPFFDQIRCTVLCDTPAWRPMLRTLQRFRFFGGRVASVTTRSIFFSVIDGLRPRPLLSLRPSRPCASKRADHVDTVGIDVFSRLAIRRDLQSFQTQQDDFRSEAIAMRTGRSVGPPLQFRPKSPHPP